MNNGRVLLTDLSKSAAARLRMDGEVWFSGTGTVEHVQQGLYPTLEWANALDSDQLGIGPDMTLRVNTNADVALTLNTVNNGLIDIDQGRLSIDNAVLSGTGTVTLTSGGTTATVVTGAKTRLQNTIFLGRGDLTTLIDLGATSELASVTFSTGCEIGLSTKAASYFAPFSAEASSGSPKPHAGAPSHRVAPPLRAQRNR